MLSYLMGYKAGAQQIQYAMKFRGWAKAKGLVKVRISWWAKQVRYFDSEYSAGFVDAHLDSTN